LVLVVPLVLAAVVLMVLLTVTAVVVVAVMVLHSLSLLDPLPSRLELPTIAVKVVT
jgi:hypothetical protein